MVLVLVDLEPFFGFAPVVLTLVDRFASLYGTTNTDDDDDDDEQQW